MSISCGEIYSKVTLCEMDDYPSKPMRGRAVAAVLITFMMMVITGIYSTQILVTAETFRPRDIDFIST